MTKNGQFWPFFDRKWSNRWNWLKFYTYLESARQAGSNDVYIDWSTIHRSNFWKITPNFRTCIILVLIRILEHRNSFPDQNCMLIIMKKKIFENFGFLAKKIQSIISSCFSQISPPTHTPTHPNSVWWHSFWCLTICTSQICEIQKFYYF